MYDHGRLDVWLNVSVCVCRPLSRLSNKCAEFNISTWSSNRPAIWIQAYAGFRLRWWSGTDNKFITAKRKCVRKTQNVNRLAVMHCLTLDTSYSSPKNCPCSLLNKLVSWDVEPRLWLHTLHNDIWRRVEDSSRKAAAAVEASLKTEYKYCGS